MFAEIIVMYYLLHNPAGFGQWSLMLQTGDIFLYNCLLANMFISDGEL